MCKFEIGHIWIRNQISWKLLLLPKNPKEDRDPALPSWLPVAVDFWAKQRSCLPDRPALQSSRRRQPLLALCWPTLRPPLRQKSQELSRYLKTARPRCIRLSPPKLAPSEDQVRHCSPERWLLPRGWEGPRCGGEPRQVQRGQISQTRVQPCQLGANAKDRERA